MNDELIRALAAQQQGQARLPGLELQLERANALRDQQFDPRQYSQGGIGAGMHGLATMINQNTGRKRAQALNPQLEQMRSQIAGGERETALHRFRRQAEQDQFAQDKDLRDQEWRQQQQAYREEQDRLRHGVALRRAAAAEKVASTKGYTAKPWTESQQEGMASSASQASALKYLGNDLDKIAEAEQSIEIPGQLINEFLNEGTRRGWENYFLRDEDETGTLGSKLLRMGLDPAQQGALKTALQVRNRWMAQFQDMYAMKRGHEIFGSAFTAAEQAIWKQALNIHIGMPADQLKARLSQLQNSAVRMARKKYNMAVAGGNPANVSLAARALLDNELASPEELESLGTIEIPEYESSVEKKEEAEEIAELPPPEMGTVRNGYRLIDPTDPTKAESWEKVE